MEPSSSFDNRTYPVLENFWKSVVQEPKAPNPRKYNENVVLESPALYRSESPCNCRHASTHMFKAYEIQKTIEMANAGAAKWRDIKGPSDSEIGDEQDGQALSDTSDSCESLIKYLNPTHATSRRGICQSRGDANYQGPCWIQARTRQNILTTLYLTFLTRSRPISVHSRYPSIYHGSLPSVPYSLYNDCFSVAYCHFLVAYPVNRFLILPVYTPHI